MNQTPEKVTSLSIVGRNIMSALLAWKLLKYKNLKISWHQSIEDQKHSGFIDWVLIPNDTVLEELGYSGFARLNEIYFYTQRHHKIRMSALLKSLQSGNSRDLVYDYPRALWKKVISLSLWNDSTPEVPDVRSLNEFDFQRTHWMHSQPESWQAAVSSPFSGVLAPREPLIRLFEDLLTQDNRIHVVHGNQAVMGIQAKTGGTDSHKLVNNAPFGISLTDTLLWTSHVAALREEIDQRGVKKFTKHDSSYRAHWKSWGGFVESKYVSAIPVFSIHFDETHLESRFTRTGCLENACIKRVLVIPPHLHHQDKDKVWLQVDEFQFKDQEQTYHPTYVVGFLKSFCPELANQQDAIGNIKELPLRDENLIFQSPLSESLSLTPGIMSFKGSFLESLDKQSDRVLTQLRIPRSLSVDVRAKSNPEGTESRT